MTAKSAIVGVLALAAIGGSVYVMVQGQAPSKPKLDEATKYWILVAMGGRYACPHCGKDVTLTDQQMRIAKPPKLTCPECGKEVDFSKPPPPAPTTQEPPAKAP